MEFRPIAGIEVPSVNQRSSSDNALDTVRTELRTMGSRRSFRRGEALMRDGGRSDEVMLIEAGRVKVILSDPAGRELMVGLYGPGELVGELGVLNDGPRTASVIAHTSVTVVSIPASRFRSFVMDDRRAMVLVFTTVQQRLRDADRWRMERASLDVPTRVVRQLQIWAGTIGQPVSGGVAIRGLSQKDLAQSIGASAKTVEQALRYLRRRGLVHTSNGRFVVPNLATLGQWSDGPGWGADRAPRSPSNP